MTDFQIKSAALAAFPLIALSLFVSSCASQRKVDYVRSGSVAATIELPPDRVFASKIDAPTSALRDTLMVKGDDGEQVYVMKAIKADDGGMVVTDVIDAAVVTARFRHVAERHGKVDIAFRITVPKGMMDREWQVRLDPDMFALEDSTRLESVIINGDLYRHAQLRGYERYNKFLASIVSDTTRFINMWQLEIFLERNIPQVYAFRTDSTEVSEEQFTSSFGVTEREAIKHYTNQIAVRMNNRRRMLRDRMYRKYVKDPIVTDGVRLDTVLMNPDGSFSYDYVETIDARPKLRKVDVCISGAVRMFDKVIYNIPKGDPLTFYISSPADFADGRERYLTKVVERRVGANASCHLAFRQGRSELDPTLSDNASQLSVIKTYFKGLLDNETFDLDSITVASFASPEGREPFNRTLAGKRSESVSRFLRDYTASCRDSIERARGVFIDAFTGDVSKATTGDISFSTRVGGENWDGLDRLVAIDPELLDVEKDDYRSVRGIKDADERERVLSRKPYYKRLRDELYPALRTVELEIRLHRRGMVKDTVHTTVLDTAYMNGVQSIRDREYDKAAKALLPYNDYNTAVAMVALDRNAGAKAILEKEKRTAPVNYLLAIVYSRLGLTQDAVQSYMDACRQDRNYVNRGNLDPEISALIKAYGLNKQPDDDDLYE